MAKSKFSCSGSSSQRSQRFYVCHHEIGDDDTNNYSGHKESKEAAHTSSGEASWSVLKSNETRGEREISEIKIHGFGKMILRFGIRERKSLLFI